MSIHELFLLRSDSSIKPQLEAEHCHYLLFNLDITRRTEPSCYKTEVISPQ